MNWLWGIRMGLQAFQIRACLFLTVPRYKVAIVVPRKIVAEIGGIDMEVNLFERKGQPVVRGPGENLP